MRSTGLGGTKNATVHHNDIRHIFNNDEIVVEHQKDDSHFDGRKMTSLLVLPFNHEMINKSKNI